MMNKRSFLKRGASALAAVSAAPAALAGVRPSLGDLASHDTWLAHRGRVFQVDGHTVTLKSVSARPCSQPGEQFSLGFEGRLPDNFGDGLHLLTGHSGEPVMLYLARTPGGLRADFCRLQG